LLRVEQFAKPERRLNSGTGGVRAIGEEVVGGDHANRAGLIRGGEQAYELVVAGVGSRARRERNVDDGRSDRR
jgi:hypothetical protein